jgi:hypothetical protein
MNIFFVTVGAGVSCIDGKSEGTSEGRSDNRLLDGEPDEVLAGAFDGSAEMEPNGLDGICWVEGASDRSGSILE